MASTFFFELAAGLPLMYLDADQAFGGLFAVRQARPGLQHVLINPTQMVSVRPIVSFA